VTSDYILTIEKEEWRDYEISIIKNAIEDARRKAAQIILIDERKAIVIDVTPYGFEEKFEIDLPAGKKMDEKEKEKIKEKKYKEILQGLNKESITIIAGPGFEKENMEMFLRQNGYRTKIANASYAEMSSIKELLESGIIDAVIGEARIIKEAKIVEETLLKIYKNEEAVYGKENVKKAIEYNAIDYIIVLDKLIIEKEIREILKEAEEKLKAKVHIISSNHEWGEKLKGLSGIAAKLRFKIDE